MIHGVVHDALTFSMPAESCDCHTHVFGPTQKYPFAPDRQYTPGDASLAELLSLQRHLGLDRVVIVQPSPYGADNTCTLDALRDFDVLLNLVREGKVWVKLSTPQRISSAPDCADAGAIAKALIAANPDRLVWGSDWPHPGARPGVPRKIDEVELFNPVNDGRALNRLAEWAGNEATLRKILVDNPAILYGFKNKTKPITTGHNNHD